MIKKNTLDLIGNTPLIKLDKISNANLNVYGKLEFLQPGGSIKDRVAYQMIKDAYASGRLKKGQTVVEMTSGNMGAGLAVVCKQFGNPFITIMSKGNSPERRKILKALGAEVVLAEQVDGRPGKVTGNDINHAAEIAVQLAIDKGAFYADQFNNLSNIKAHFQSTGPEILTDLPEIDAFVAAIGSGGTFVGCSRYLKNKKPNIRCIAVEPEHVAILKNGKIENTKHIIQGTGYGLVTPFWDRDLADDIISVNDDEVIDMTKKLSHDQGLFVGFSSGANVVAAIKYAKQNKEIKNIVTILCDTGYKYTDL